MIHTAWAQEATAPQGSVIDFLPLLLIFAVIYFLLIRPSQQKARRQETFLASLKKGDMVVTSGGIFGTIDGLTDKVVTLEVARDVKMRVLRSDVAAPQSEVLETAASAKGADLKVAEKGHKKGH